MITTEFLPVHDYSQYKDWLIMQDEETRQMYFGITGSHYVIETLMDRVIKDPDRHYFLVAKDGARWVGTVHIALHKDTVELGVIVDEEYRRQGIAGQMVEEAIVWTRNRGYHELNMHCLGQNQPINNLCRKHGMAVTNMMGDSMVKVQLPPPNWVTINQEICTKQRNMFRMLLQPS
jgi:RimJ/RimL family protein N-acetyltransferase